MALPAPAEARIGRAARFAPPPLSPLGLAAAVPAAVILGLLAVVLWISVLEDVTRGDLTLQHYADLYGEPLVYGALLNTLGFALSTVAVAMLFGVPAAWLAERTDLPGKTVLYTGMTVGVLIPGFFTAMGWILLLHPNIGLVNQLIMQVTGAPSGPLNVGTIPGMGWVQGLGLAALVFIMTAANLRSMDAALEESAQVHGADFLTTLRRITLPLAWPAVLAAGLYVFTIGISAFDVPLVIGLSNRILTFSTFVYTMANPSEGMPRYGLTAAFSSFMVLVALLVSWWYGRVLLQARKYEVVTGKNYRPKRVALGRWAIAAWGFLGGYLLLAIGLPLLLLVWAALVPYFQPPSLAALQTVSLQGFQKIPWPSVVHGLTNTVILMLGAPTLTVLMSLAISWVVLRSRSRFRVALDVVAFLPHAVPNVIFGLSALIVALFVIPRQVDLYGSIALTMLVMAIAAISFGTRVTNGALIQVHRELEEAGYISGASTLGVMRRIIVPLLRPALMYGWLWMALLAYRDLTLPLILYSAENVTLSVVIWHLWSSYSRSVGAAVSLVMLVLLLPLIVAYWRLRRGIEMQ
jgi:iron(III) transport system permease protein